MARHTCSHAELAANLGRVADVRPGDFDGDGDQDLIVAEFGWRETGTISALENLGLNAALRATSGWGANR